MRDLLSQPARPPSQANIQALSSLTIPSCAHYALIVFLLLLFPPSPSSSFLPVSLHHNGGEVRELMVNTMTGLGAVGHAKAHRRHCRRPVHNATEVASSHEKINLGLDLTTPSSSGQWRLTERHFSYLPFLHS